MPILAFSSQKVHKVQSTELCELHEFTVKEKRRRKLRLVQ